MRPGVNISTRDASTNVGIVTRLGTGFLATMADQGPVADPYLATSYDSFRTAYGPPIATVNQAQHNQALAFFAEGGARLYVSRITGTAPVRAGFTLVDRATTPLPTLRVQVGTGAYYNAWSVSVVAGVTAATYVLIVTDANGGVVTRSPDLVDPTAAVQWASQVPEITVTDLASGSTGVTRQPALLAPALFTGGTDDRATATPAGWVAKLGLDSLELGPGQVIAEIDPSTAATVLPPLAAACRAANRIALVTPTVIGTATEVVALAATYRSYVTLSTDRSYLAVFPSHGTIRDVAGLEQRVPGCAIAAGLIARNDVAEGPSQPAAGPYGIARNVVRLVNEFPVADIDRINAAGFNCFKSTESTIRLYGFRSLDLIANRKSLADARVLMAIRDELNAYSEAHGFPTLDAQGLAIADYGAGVANVLARYHEQKDLYGATAEEAYTVDVGPAVNTPATIAAGEIHVLTAVKTSPFAEVAYLELVKAPTSQTLTVSSSTALEVSQPLTTEVFS